MTRILKRAKSRRGLGYLIVGIIGFILGWLIATNFGGQGGILGLRTAPGFDQFGYNYNARIFVGKADGVDRMLDGEVWGDPTYANDHLVMDWSAGWDCARFSRSCGKGDTPGVWTPQAWLDNEWSGVNQTTGKHYTEHYKIIWVGSSLQNSRYWRSGGTPIWGEFEIIQDVYTEKGIHYNFTVQPAGFGASEAVK